MPRTKKTTDNITSDFAGLAERVSDVAKLVVNSKDRHVGLLNVGPDIVIFLSTGGQVFLNHKERLIVDEFTFKGVMARAAWGEGHVLRDDSILLASMIPADKTPKIHNAIFDHEIEELIQNPKKCEQYILKCTSLLTIERIVEFLNKNKRANSELLIVCEERLFLLMNQLPDDFYTAGLDTLERIIKQNDWPEILYAERGEDASVVREKIIQFLNN